MCVSDATLARAPPAPRSIDTPAASPRAPRGSEVTASEAARATPPESRRAHTRRPARTAHIKQGASRRRTSVKQLTMSRAFSDMLSHASAAASPCRLRGATRGNASGAETQW